MWKSLMMLTAVILGKDLCLFVESTCVLGKTNYADGDVWRFNECVNCTCNGTRVDCVKEHCPTPSCTEPKIVPGVCCPFCEVVPGDNGEADNGGKGCQYDGDEYSDGEVFTSNSTGIILNADNQCINCICTKGDVLCYLKTCNIPKKCKKWLNHSDNCCRQCADCLDSEGTIHENGSEWRPQVSNCVTCSCLNGEIDCHKLTCPPDDLLPCKNPRRRGNSCCKTCRRKKKPRKVCLTSMRRKNKRNKKKNGKRQNRKKDRKNRNQDSQSGTAPVVDVTSLPSLRDNIDTNNLTIPDFYGQMCMSKKRDHIVYRYVGGRFLFVAFDDAKSHQVEVWRWRLKQRVCDVNLPAQKKCKAMSANIRLSGLEKFTFPSDHFRKQVTQEMIFGSTPKKQVRNFKKKLIRSMAKCSKKNKCRVKMVTRAIYKNIDLKHVSYNCGC
ncbi:uncharacterized protein LOC132561972 isoform X2 [Ylistrum balloti]|uniref:uncharacterized protein LOC132561972 isoform X2 n=1 Tax=Ylistrum balloti TaxID=509963 RepID=UPI002905B9C6|nr:uncharacterized protein LOC132561972 isoform X2 [Ylistrum balloti]